MNSIKLRIPDDFHVHFRTGELLQSVINYTTNSFGRALVMPNLKVPISNAQLMNEYRKEIKNSVLNKNFKPLMTIKLLKTTKPEDIIEAKNSGLTAVKLYPEGVTTNSEDGISDFESLYPIFDVMEKLGVVLSVHGEAPNSYVLDRENDFLPILDNIIINFPKLKIVLEHITTSNAVNFIMRKSDNVAATITIHHLLTTLDDVIGGYLNPTLFCKPIPKTKFDKLTLRLAVLSGNPKFFFGSDTAPHNGEDKYHRGCPGVFTAPVSLPLLVDFFEFYDSLDKLEDFVSVFGSRFYGLDLNDGHIYLNRTSWIVPESIDTIPVFYGGKEIKWKIC